MIQHGSKRHEAPCPYQQRRKKRTFSPTANRHPRMRIPTNQGKRVWTAYALPNVDDRAQNTGITGRVSAVGRGAINEDEWRAINESGGQWKSGGNRRELGAMGEWRAVEESGGRWKRKSGVHKRATNAPLFPTQRLMPYSPRS
jgi:hypothetical protein